MPHITDPLRVSICVQYVQHELRKIFPHVRGSEKWRSFDEQVRSWGDDPRKIWNRAHGISMSFRLKSIVPLVTSLNISWNEENADIGELWFGSKGFGSLGDLQIEEESGGAVREALFSEANRDALAAAKQKLKSHAESTEPRDDDPIIVVEKGNRLRVIDGNRRLLQAIVHGQKHIRAHVGLLEKEPMHFEHWVPTQLLVDLVYWYNHHLMFLEDHNMESIAQIIADLIRDSSAGRQEFKERAIHSDNEAHELLLVTVRNNLRDHGVDL